MSVYVVGDTHGMFDKFQELLQAICFDETKDELVFVGDIHDKGTGGLDIWKWIIAHPKNAFVVCGNHETMMIDFLLEEDEELKIKYLQLWMDNKGEPTLKALRALPQSEMLNIVHYIMDETTDTLDVTVEDDNGNTNKYRIVHGWYEPGWDFADIVWQRPTFDQEYQLMDTETLIIGHTPACFMDAEKLGVDVNEYVQRLQEEGDHVHIYHGKGWIDVDCGSGNQHRYPALRLAAICLNTMEEFYV